MITREFNLYLHAGHSIPLVINANQYDHGEQWIFTLYNSDGTKYVPSSGAIVGIKSDNLGIINSGSVDTQGRVVINETQQMTAAVGKAVFELVIDDGTHGTANFVVLVEPKPGDNADLSETDISMIEQAIEAASTIKPYGSPLVASTVAGMTDHEKVYVYVGSETGYTSGNWYYWDGSAWTSGGVYNSVAVQTDTTLTLSGVAADAKKTGDEISDLKSRINAIIEGGGGFRDEAKQTLLAFLSIVASSVENGQDYYDAFANALLNKQVLSLNAVFTQEGLIYTNDQLDDLKQYLTVTAYYDDGTSGEITTYTLTGTLEEGTSTITATYGTVSTTFDVVVTATILPYGYHRVEYIESDGGQQILINGGGAGVAHTGNTLTIGVEYYKAEKPSDKARDIFNAFKVNSAGFVLEFGFAQNVDNRIFAYSSSSAEVIDPIIYGNRCLAEAVFAKSSPYATLTITSGETVLTGTKTSANSTNLWSNLTCYLFGYDLGTTKTRCSGKVYDFYMEDSNGEIFHGIPCYRVSDGEIGIYDIVGNGFYTNDGDGTFTKGADI